MAKANGYTLTKHQRYWLNHIQACEASGKSIAAYAREHGLEVKAMYSGKTILVTKGALPRTHSPQFQRVQAVDTANGGQWRVQLANGVSVSFTGTPDAGTLTTILTTAARLG
jgi:hypothetical protein